MNKTPDVNIIARNYTYGEVRISINGKSYLYRFPALEYFKNKGIFLQKIKPFLVKD